MADGQGRKWRRAELSCSGNFIIAAGEVPLSS
jgi:hypothetical protein